MTRAVRALGARTPEHDGRAGPGAGGRSARASAPGRVSFLAGDSDEDSYSSSRRAHSEGEEESEDGL